MSYNIYPKLPTAPEDLGTQGKFNASVVNSELSELNKLKQTFESKIEKYKKKISKLIKINAGASAIAIGSGVSTVATTATIVGIPISAGLGGVALVSSICSGITTASIKKYQKKLQNVLKLHDIVSSAIAVFELNVSQALDNGIIEYKEFHKLQGVYYSALELIASTDRKMESETQKQFQKSLLTEIESLKRQNTVENI